MKSIPNYPSITEPLFSFGRQSRRSPWSTCRVGHHKAVGAVRKTPTKQSHHPWNLRRIEKISSCNVTNPHWKLHWIQSFMLFGNSNKGRMQHHFIRIVICANSSMSLQCCANMQLAERRRRHRAFTPLTHSNRHRRQLRSKFSEMVHRFCRFGC